MSELSDPGAPNTRGRRNPQVAAEIAAARARERQAQSGQAAFEGVPDEAMQFDSGLLDENEGELAQPSPSLTLLGEGAVVMAKRSSQVLIDGNEHWFTLAVQDRVYEDEDHVGAWTRLSEFVNTGTNDLIADAEEGIREENRRRYDEERRAHITPRSNR